MSRALAIMLAGAGMADLAYIDAVLAPRLFSARAEIKSSAAAAKGEAKTDTHSFTRPADIDSVSRRRSTIATGAKADRSDREVGDEHLEQAKPAPAMPSPTMSKWTLSATDQKKWLLLFPVASQDWVPRQAEQPLATIARHIKASPNHDVLVLGHCDARGSQEANHDLGKRRARAIAQHLMTLGVDETRIQVLSLGEEQPAVDGWNRYAWSRNRRVEVVLRPHETRSLNR